MRKNDAKPTNMPSLRSPELSATDLGGAIEGGKGTIPDQDVALLLDHDEVHAAALVLAHERVRHEVEEHVREQAAGLSWAARDQRRPGRGGHGREGEGEKRTAKAVMVLSVFGLIWAGMNARMKLGTLSSRGRWRESARGAGTRARHSRANVERPQNCKMRGGLAAFRMRTETLHRHVRRVCRTASGPRNGMGSVRRRAVARALAGGELADPCRSIHSVCFDLHSGLSCRILENSCVAD